MRRGEQSSAQARRAINALEHGAGRAFAICAGDVNETKLILRMARQRSELEGVFQTELRAEQTQVVKELDGFGISHFEIYLSAFDGESDVVVRLVSGLDVRWPLAPAVFLAVAADAVNHITFFPMMIT